MILYMLRIQAIVKFHFGMLDWIYLLPRQVSFLATPGLALTQITLVLNLNVSGFVSHITVQCI